MVPLRHAGPATIIPGMAWNILSLAILFCLLFQVKFEDAVEFLDAFGIFV